MAEIRAAPGAPMPLGATLRAGRHARGLRLREVAVAVDVSVAYVSEIERGTRVPPPQTLMRLAPVVGLEPADLIWRWLLAHIDRDTARAVAAYVQTFPEEA